MIQKFTDFWKELEIRKYDAIVCTTNCIVKQNGELVMGKGIALDFNIRYPGLARTWGQRTKDLIDQGKRGQIIISQHNKKDIWLVSLPTKYHFRDNSYISLITQNCNELMIVADAMGWHNILMTQPGCGNGGLSWLDVKYKIDFLDDRFHVVCNGANNAIDAM